MLKSTHKKCVCDTFTIYLKFHRCWTVVWNAQKKKRTREAPRLTSLKKKYWKCLPEIPGWYPLSCFPCHEFKGVRPAADPWKNQKVSKSLRSWMAVSCIHVRLCIRILAWSKSDRWVVNSCNIWSVWFSFAWYSATYLFFGRWPVTCKCKPVIADAFKGFLLFRLIFYGSNTFYMIFFIFFVIFHRFCDSQGVLGVLEGPRTAFKAKV